MALEELNLVTPNPKDTTDEEEELGFDLVDDDDEEEDLVGETEEDEDDDEEDLVDEDDDDDEEETSDDDNGDDEDLVDSDDDDEDEEEDLKPSRENNRIRSLVESANKAKAEAAQSRADNLAIQKQMIELQKSTKTSTLGILKNQVKGIKAQMVKAQEDSEAAKLIDLQEELNKTQMDINALDSWNPPEIPTHEEAPKGSQQEQFNKELDSAPEAAQDWFVKNAWFRDPKTPEDIERQQEAIVYSQMLTGKGYSLDSKELFDLVDSRLKKLGLAKPSKSKEKFRKQYKEHRVVPLKTNVVKPKSLFPQNKRI